MLMLNDTVQARVMDMLMNMQGTYISNKINFFRKKKQNYGKLKTVRKKQLSNKYDANEKYLTYSERRNKPQLIKKEKFM